MQPSRFPFAVSRNIRLRTLLLFLLLLAAGAAVNVAVAWGCARWMNPSTVLRVSDTVEHGIAWETIRLRSPISDTALSFWTRVDVPDRRAAERGPETLVPWWSDIKGPTHEFMAGDAASEMRMDQATGWPLPSMHVQLDLVSKASGQSPTVAGVRGGVRSRHAGPVPFSMEAGAFPLLPIWLAFAFDTIVYSVVLCVAHSGARRWVVSRSRPAEATYDIRSLLLNRAKRLAIAGYVLVVLLMAGTGICSWWLTVPLPGVAGDCGIGAQGGCLTVAHAPGAWRTAIGPASPQWLWWIRYSSVGTATYLHIPLWLPLMVVGTLAFCLSRLERYRVGMCKHCNYDLRGIGGTVCPECGTQVVAPPGRAGG